MLARSFRELASFALRPSHAGVGIFGAWCLLCVACQDGGQELSVGFFVTSVGNGRGGDLGGLSGADARCQSLARAQGLPVRTWRAFLSATGPVHARDRIGTGPWTNAAGDVVAADLDGLLRHGVASEDMLDERGLDAAKSPPPGREHDILTGSDEEGRLIEGRTCADWTSSSPDDRVVVGHHDWAALPNDEWEQHWIRVHGAPCDPQGMARQLGTARFYCFAAD